MPYNIYCWSCARHYRATNNAENPVCPNCGDSFVEIDDNVCQHVEELCSLFQWVVFP